MVAPRTMVNNICHVTLHFALPFLIGMIIAAMIVIWQTGSRSGTDEIGEYDAETEMERSIREVEGSRVAKDEENDDDQVLSKFEYKRVTNSKSWTESSNDSPKPTTSKLITNATEGGNSLTSDDEAALRASRRQQRAERAAKGSWNCRHRWTRWLGQNSQYVPLELANLLERYNRLHDRALRELPIEEAFTLPLTSARNNVRYLVWRPVGEDLAGRLLSLTSAFLLALLTDRILLVNFPHVRTLFCEPFTRSSWIFPQGYLSALNRFTSIDAALQTRAPLRIVRLRLNDQFRSDDSIHLTCQGHVKGLLSHVQIFLVESPVGFIELLQQNPSHRDRLMAMFERRSPYGPLMGHLFHPSNDMWFRLIDAYHTHYTNDYDRPTRLAVNFQMGGGIEPATDAPLNSGDTPGDNLILRHQIRCALNLTSPKLGPKGLVIYYAPSNPLNNPSTWTERLLRLLTGRHRIVTSADSYPGEGLVADWRRLLTDIWMSSWSEIYALGNVSSQAAIAAHYYRRRESTAISRRAGPEGECQVQPLGTDFQRQLPEATRDCTAFRQAWRAKHRDSLLKAKQESSNKDVI